MPTAVLDIDAAALPSDIALPRRYGQAVALIRWHGQPVGRVTLPAREGTISPEALRAAVHGAAGERILELRLREWLGVATDPAPPLTRPATVAICTRDRPDDLARCLRALRRMPDDGQQILVVDSASRSDETRRVALAAEVDYVREERPGLDRARNRALLEASHDLVAFTDDDAAPDACWLRALCSGFRDERTLAVTGLTLALELETEAQEWFERTNGFARGFRAIAYDGTKHDPLLAARVGAGVNMALRRSVLERVGFFDDALDAGTPAQSGGDHDMFTRILARGYSIQYEPCATSWHRHRRDWPSLRAAVRGYGIGVYAYLARQWLELGEWRAPVIALGWLRTQLPALARALLRRPGHVPLDVAIYELWGCTQGVGAFLRSRREAGPERRGGGG